MHTGCCLLCSKEAELQHSHVLPAFVFRWQRESSANGHIRTTQEPNKRVQDGLKHYWLCKSCEDLFSQTEGMFANRVFRPYTDDGKHTIQYGSWLSHFCASVSWRVLRHYQQESDFSDTPEFLRARMVSAEETWRKFLLGEVQHPGEHQLHLIPMDEISSSSMNLPSNMNRYIMRAIHMDLCQSKSLMFTYAKMGRFIVLGFVHESHLNHWRGTKVHANAGLIAPKKYTLPNAFGEYLMQKSQAMRDALDSINERQQEKIDKAFKQNIDRYAKSDAYRAMNADVALFGKSAFRKPTK